MTQVMRPLLDQIEQPAGAVWVAEVPDWTGPGSPRKIGIATEAIRQRAGRGLRVLIGQLYGIVGPSLIMAEHVFQGLKRDMYVRGDRNADVKKLAITWAQAQDAIWVGDEVTGNVAYLPPPKDRVFVVYVSPNEMLERFPSIHGWAEHWTWIAADPNTAGAPIDWETRYDACLWNK
jgi:hypothetical protein